MIYEVRSYRLKPGSTPEVIKRFGEGYESRKKYSELAGRSPKYSSAQARICSGSMSPTMVTTALLGP